MSMDGHSGLELIGLCAHPGRKLVGQCMTEAVRHDREAAANAALSGAPSENLCCQCSKDGGSELVLFSEGGLLRRVLHVRGCSRRGLRWAF